MAELATLARPYSQALFRATQESGSVEVAAKWLADLALIAADPAFANYAAHPKTTAKALIDFVASVQGKPLPEEGQRFLRLIVDAKRLNVLPEIADQFEQLKNDAQGVREARVQTPYPIDGQELVRLQAKLEKRFGGKLHLTTEIDPELIGGLRVTVGDEVLDISFQAKLAELYAHLLQPA